MRHLLFILFLNFLLFAGPFFKVAQAENPASTAPFTLEKTATQIETAYAVLCSPTAKASAKQSALTRLNQYAKKGDFQAQTVLGIVYRKGRGVERDPAKARQWLLGPARSGYPMAQYYLGLDLVEQAAANQSKDDLLWAYIWLHRAAENDFNKAQIAFNEVEGHLNEADRQKAQALAKMIKTANRPNTMRAQVPPPTMDREKDETPLILTEVAGRWLYHREIKRLFVVNGKVNNATDRPRPTPAVIVSLLGPQGQALQQKLVVCAQPLSDQQIAQMPTRTLMLAMQAREAEQDTSLWRQSSFTATFINPPPHFTAFDVKIKPIW